MDCGLLELGWLRQQSDPVLGRRCTPSEPPRGGEAGRPGGQQRAAQSAPAVRRGLRGKAEIQGAINTLPARSWRRLPTGLLASERPELCFDGRPHDGRSVGRRRQKSLQIHAM
jgi:hypothetical protein